MTLILTIEIHVLQKRAYLTYSAIKVVYTAFTIIFVNDMFNVSNVLFNVLYADDTCIYIYIYI